MADPTKFIRAWFAAIALLAAAVFGLLWRPGQDHLGAISRQGDASWFMNYRYSFAPARREAQDREILYFDIGHTISRAKAADVVVLGHSMVLFALDWRLLEAFSRAHKVEVFNLASGGDTSGEFLLRVIEKHRIQAPIFVINADDTKGSYFRPHVLGEWGAGDTTKETALQGYRNVVARNLRWRAGAYFEDYLLPVLPGELATRRSVVNYRSNAHGSWLNDTWPNYLATNPSFGNSRPADCGADAEEYELARNFINRLRAVSANATVVLTLVPYANACPQRVRDIAAALQLPAIIVDQEKWTAVDRGGHLDAAGARRFTAAFLSQLEALDPFKKLEMKKKREE